MYIHLEKDGTTDPRVLRTRELLINSFAKLLIELRSIRKVSVQGVSQEAGVNRVTFYAHFRDKYDLLDVWARLMFRESVVKKLPAHADFSHDNLVLLISGTLDFFLYRYRNRRKINEEFEPIFEAAVQQEIQSILQVMLEATTDKNESLSNEHVASFLSWAIFGSALDFSRSPTVPAKDTTIQELVAMIEVMTK